jgi:hypothetical protein
MRTFYSALLLFTASFSIQSRQPAAVPSPRTTVYICVTGKVYHAYRSCRGLRNATHEIRAVSESEAINEWNRRKCKVCY